MEAHRATTESEGYALLTGRTGLKVREADGDEEGGVAALLPARGVVEITARNASMPQLAETLRRSMGTPVWDRTGLAGRYDFQFRYALDENDASVAEPWIGTALQETLGLRLEKQKGLVDTLVVDRIDEPSEN